MQVVRYINHEKMPSGALAPVQIRNPAVVRVLREFQRKMLEKYAFTPKN